MFLDVREFVDRSGFISFSCQMQGRVPIMIGRVDVGLARIDQRDTHVRVALLRRQVEWSSAQPVLGLDLRNSNVNNPELEKMSAEKIPDVILIKKVYADKTFRNRRRRWRLKRMEGLPHMPVGLVSQ